MNRATPHDHASAVWPIPQNASTMRTHLIREHDLGDLYRDTGPTAYEDLADAHRELHHPDLSWMPAIDRALEQGKAMALGMIAVQQRKAMADVLEGLAHPQSIYRRGEMILLSEGTVARVVAMLREVSQEGGTPPTQEDPQQGDAEPAYYFRDEEGTCPIEPNPGGSPDDYREPTSPGWAACHGQPTPNLEKVVEFHRVTGFPGGKAEFLRPVEPADFLQVKPENVEPPRAEDFPLGTLVRASIAVHGQSLRTVWRRVPRTIWSSGHDWEAVGGANAGGCATSDLFDIEPIQKHATSGRGEFLQSEGHPLDGI